MKNYAECTHNNEPPKPEGFIERYTFYIAHEICRIHALDTTETITILDVGCGNGEYCEAWKEIGFNARGIDRYTTYDETEDFEIYGVGNDFEGDCDIIHSKSFIEHTEETIFCISEMYHGLKPGGVCVMLTPDIDIAKWSFWGDIGHKSPFNANSLYQLFDIAEFKNIKVEHFYKGVFDQRWKKPLKGMLIAIGIGKSLGGGMLSCVHAHPQNDFFDVMISKDMTKFQTLLGIQKIFKGEHLNLKGVRYKYAKKVEVELESPIGMEHDGEIYEGDVSAHVIVEHMPQAYNILYNTEHPSMYWLTEKELAEGKKPDGKAIKSMSHWDGRTWMEKN